MKTDFILPFPNELQARQVSSSCDNLVIFRSPRFVISRDLANPFSVQDQSDYIESRYLNMTEFNKC